VNDSRRYRFLGAVIMAGAVAVSVGSPGTAHATSAPHLQLRNPGGWTSSDLAFSADGRYLASATEINATVWDAATGKLVTTFSNQAGGIDSVAFSPDSDVLAAGDDADGSTYLWNAATHSLLATLTGPGNDGVTDVAFGDGGAELAEDDAYWHNYVWRVASGTLVATITSPGYGPIGLLAFSPDGWLATANVNGDIYVRRE